VVKTIVTSPEFLAPERVTVRKFKTPIRARRQRGAGDGCGVSAMRGRSCRRCSSSATAALHVPAADRLQDTADAWVSAGGLVTRMNFATRLASGNMPGVTLPADAPPAQELALRLGSPEFQRH
jgi:hypothetical protein